MLLLLLASALAADPRVQLTAGVGLPELLHAEVGGWLSPRLSVEARYGNVVLNHEVGVGVDWAAWLPSGSPRGHALLVSGQAMVNPTATFSLRSGGDRLGAYGAVYGGWRWVSEAGFVARAHAGVLLYDDGGFAAGPNGIVGVGWAF